MKHIICGFDLSLHTGYASLEFDEDTKEVSIVAYGTINVVGNNDSRILNFYNRVSKTIFNIQNYERIHSICVEDTSIVSHYGIGGHKKARIANMLYAAFIICVNKSLDGEVKVSTYTPSIIKANLTGKSGAKKFAMIDKMNNLFGTSFIFSENVDTTDDNIVDAIACALVHIKNNFGDYKPVKFKTN
jgi:Holliday junction resolvasome RuvABC endonuclease subunit